MERTKFSLAITSELCHACKYGSYSSGCNYILAEGHSRIWAKDKRGHLIRLTEKGRCITFEEGAKERGKNEKMCY